MIRVGQLRVSPEGHGLVSGTPFLISKIENAYKEPIVHYKYMCTGDNNTGLNVNNTYTKTLNIIQKYTVLVVDALDTEDTVSTDTTSDIPY